MRLTAEVYLVGGSPSYGFGLSGEMDSHVYLIDGGDELALVDCGMARNDSIDRIRDNIRADGLDPARLRRVFLTHHHVDHAGGLAAWQERYGVSGAAGAECAPAVETGDPHATGFALAQAAGIYPPDYELRPATVHDRLVGGEVRRVGELTVEVIATPGHCAGHRAYRVRGRTATHLFTGDCVFTGGRISLLNTPDSDLAAYRASVLALAELEFDALLPGHGAVCLRGGHRHVAAAADAFRTLSLPENYR
ncbi:MAG TPA: MBL fold metallo-hydrolase [Natronosporangium sp.]|nr:MBL fold metallo-hydrolase [Natronosporangium sp.]